MGLRQVVGIGLREGRAETEQSGLPRGTLRGRRAVHQEWIISHIMSISCTPKMNFFVNTKFFKFF